VIRKYLVKIMENPILLLILGLQTAVILAMALAIFMTARKVIRFSDRLKVFIDSYAPRVDEIIEETEAFIRSCEQVGEHAIEISAGLRDMAETAKETADDVADVVQNTTFRAERQIDHVDHVFSDAMDRTQAAADYLTRSILPQFVEIAAMVRGIYVTINYLRGKRHFPFTE
jgi:methyl-accepting chemotaxis protein